MKELSIITNLGKVLEVSDVNNALLHIRSHRLLFVNRPYMCDEQIGGYPLSYVCLKSNELKNIIEQLEIKLLLKNILNNTHIVERGLGILNENISLENVRDKKELDLYTKQIRISLSGISKINNEILELGSAYLIDTITGYTFDADNNSVHLIFNFLNNNEIRKPWDLWVNRE